MMYLLTLVVSLLLSLIIHAIPTTSSEHASTSLIETADTSKPELPHPTASQFSFLQSVRKRGGGSSGGRPSSSRPKPRPKPFHSSSGDDGGSLDGEEDTCFPASARVTLSNHLTVNMSSLRIGDHVRLADGSYSQVYMFGHRLTSGTFPFLQLVTKTGAITLSPGHFIYANGMLVAARDLQIMDWLEKENGVKESIQSIRNIDEIGLYNPMTTAGEFVVDGFRTSVYTETVIPQVGNALLVPVRAAFKVLGMDLSFGCVENVAGHFARYARRWIGRTITTV